MALVVFVLVLFVRWPPHAVALLLGLRHGGLVAAAKSLDVLPQTTMTRVLHAGPPRQRPRLKQLGDASIGFLMACADKEICDKSG